jgi:hypothetical protein
MAPFKFSTSQYSNPIITKDSSACRLAQSVRIIIAVAILFTYALQMYVPRSILWSAVQNRWGPFKHNFLIETLLRSFLVVVTCKYIIQISGVNIMGFTQFYVHHNKCYIALSSPKRVIT